jgi:hypothetical protein
LASTRSTDDRNRLLTDWERSVGMQLQSRRHILVAAQPVPQI